MRTVATRSSTTRSAVCFWICQGCLRVFWSGLSSTGMEYWGGLGRGTMNKGSS